MPSQSFFDHQIAAEISAFTRYYDRVIQWLPRVHDRGQLLDLIDCEEKEFLPDGSRIPDLSKERDKRTAVLLNGTLSYSSDIRALLAELKPKLARTTRIVAVCHNPYLRWLYALAFRLGLRDVEAPTTFLTQSSLTTLVKISGYEIVRERPAGYCPFPLFGLGTALNRLLSVIPLVRWLSASVVVCLRPVIAQRTKPSLSIIVPARNERGNIRSALERMPDFGGANLEVVFVEGHSSDGTWEEIQRVINEPGWPMTCKAYQQTGVGKADAVRLGFENASGDLLTILDADLTMPPELLPSYYECYRQGHGDFINGSRLVYPMEGGAMRFLNQLGNIFFAKAITFVTESRISDALCGTKLVARHDYRRFTRWREHFGDFDPFGDFELIFPASVLGLGIVDVPVRYRMRTYGETQIRRFRDGWRLLKMVGIGFLRIKLGRA
jgi:hypothetical protein